MFLDALSAAGKIISQALFPCSLVCAMIGCNYQGSSPQRSNSLVIAVVAEPSSLNPLLLQGGAASDVSALGYSFLTKYGTNDAIITDLARVVPSLANGGISRDGKQVIYHLRRDALWQDGYPLTARDVVFTYHAIMNPLNAVPSRSGFDRIKSIRIPNPYTVIVSLTEPDAPFVAQFFGGDSNYPILPAHLLAGYQSLNHVPFNEAPVGSGPYRFTRWLRADRLDLTANDRYYGGRPSVQHLSIRVVRDSTTIVNQLSTHEVDATFFAIPSTITALRSIADHRVIVTPVPYFAALVFNMRDSILNDLAVRRALALAIDRRSVVKKATLGLYDADTGMRGMFTWAFDRSAGKSEYNRSLARSLLRQDGWAPSSDGIRMKNGRRLEVQLIFNAHSFARAEVVPMIIESARNVGIDLVTRAEDPNAMVSLDGPLYQGKFQVALLTYQHSIDPDPSDFVTCAQRAPKGFNWPRYCNEDVDRDALRGLLTYDRAERRRFYGLIQRRLGLDVPYYFLWQTSEIDVLPSDLRGYQPSGGSPFNSVAHWRLDGKAT